MKRSFFALTLAMVLLLAACLPGQPSAAPQQTLTIFAAASLTNAFDELTNAFETGRPNVDVLLNYGGSSQLAAQLNEGAQADLFASANSNQMENVINNGRISAGNETIFVSNRLAVVVPADNPAQINTLEDLAQSGVQLILAIEGVPVRQYSDELIASMTADFQMQFYNNLVSEEDNVRRVSAKVALGEADAGIVYASDITPDISNQLQQIIIPESKNVVATYPIAPLDDARQPELAEQFIQFVLSVEGQTILAKWGFGPPHATK